MTRTSSFAIRRALPLGLALVASFGAHSQERKPAEQQRRPIEERRDPAPPPAPVPPPSESRPVPEEPAPKPKPRGLFNAILGAATGIAKPARTRKNPQQPTSAACKLSLAFTGDDCCWHASASWPPAMAVGSLRITAASATMLAPAGAPGWIVGPTTASSAVFKPAGQSPPPADLGTICFAQPGAAPQMVTLEVIAPDGSVICADTTATDCATGLGSFGGVKFDDRNGNGVRDPGEPGLPGWTIEVYDGKGGTLKAVTQADGSWSVGGLAAGTYVIQEIGQSPWVQTAPMPDVVYTVDLPSGQRLTGLDFGNTLKDPCFVMVSEKVACIREGAWSLTLELKNVSSFTAGMLKIVPADPLLIVTPASFTMAPGGLAPGATTSVTATLTGPAAKPGKVCLTIEMSAKKTHDSCRAEYCVRVPSCPGRKCCSLIQGTKFNDLDGDGRRDAGEPGLPGWSIRVEPTGETAVTDAFGTYFLGSLCPGNYTIFEERRPDWIQTAPGGGAGLSVLVPEQPGVVIPNVDFGNVSTVEHEQGGGSSEKRSRNASQASSRLKAPLGDPIGETGGLLTIRPCRINPLQTMRVTVDPSSVPPCPDTPGPAGMWGSTGAKVRFNIEWRPPPGTFQAVPPMPPNGHFTVLVRKHRWPNCPPIDNPPPPNPKQREYDACGNCLTCGCGDHQSPKVLEAAWNASPYPIIEGAVMRNPYRMTFNYPPYYPDGPFAAAWLADMDDKENEYLFRLSYTVGSVTYVSNVTSFTYIGCQ